MGNGVYARPVDTHAFEHHLNSPQGQGALPADGVSVTAVGGACGDTITLSLATDGERVSAAGFEADGCGAATAAASAAIALARGRPVLDAARIGARAIAEELGGLGAAKLHAAEVAADALGRALGAAARRDGAVRSPGPHEPQRTLVAMSGGVDSTVAALLAAKDGEAVGVTVELWADREHDPQRSCCSASAVSQARALAHSLGMPHFTLDLREEFRASVVDPFIASFASGETPNPCTRCNGEVRLDAMLELADRLGACGLATGHYARVAPLDGDAPAPLLRLAADSGKDQTYMLAALAPESLERMRFPLGELTKPQVRQMAAEAGLPVAGKGDSQDLCFLAGTDRGRFLARHGGIGRHRGEVVDRSGAVLGVHDGHERFTVGQRRGLGVATPGALYVLEKDAARNRVVVGPREGLLAQGVRLRSVRLHRDGRHVNAVRLRYRSAALPCRLEGDPPAGEHAAASVQLGEPFAGVAPGQLACLMDGELIVGWGTIDGAQRTA
jgi:tRNA-specific 2-thiouridylase